MPLTDAQRLEWERDARTRQCPLCKQLPEYRCLQGSGKKRLELSHAVRGQSVRGFRVAL